MAFAENNQWVIIEAHEVGDKVDYVVEPQKLELRAGWSGTIIWHVFTPGFELSSTAGVAFPPDSGFDGHPRPDETRPGCWSTFASNNGAGTFAYTVAVQRLSDLHVSSIDPVVENDPPVPGQLQKRRPARRREGARRQNAS